MENQNKEFKVNKKIEKFSKTLGITGKNKSQIKEQQMGNFEIKEY